uniref:C2H2-type domain-containing protein n=1 Tax=Steinernema glaseri TaxID=37863 RepID=A0A1I7Z013_9BILA
MLLAQWFAQQSMNLLNPILLAPAPQVPEAPVPEVGLEQAPGAPVPEAPLPQEASETPRRTAAPSLDSPSESASTPRRAKRRYECPQCGTTVSRKFLLVGHMRIHTGEKPFQCELCGKRFPLALYLKKHQRRSHGESVKPTTKEGDQLGRNQRRRTL